MSRSTAPLDRAIIPAAGFGTRLRPLTHAIPKEMLPLGRKPVLEYVVEELRAAGIRRILMVVSPAKTMVRDYFGDGTRWGVCCEYAVQTDMRGLGDAVLQGESWAQRQPFVVAFGDCLIQAEAIGEGGHMQRLIDVFADRSTQAAVLTEEVDAGRVQRYGILSPVKSADATPGGEFAFDRIVEKPSREAAPSRCAVAARYVLDARIFDYIRLAGPRPDGEVDLATPVSDMLSATGAFGWAVPLLPGETRRDIGSWDSYLAAAARSAATDPECGNAVRAALCDVCSQAPYEPDGGPAGR